MRDSVAVCVLIVPNSLNRNLKIIYHKLSSKSYFRRRINGGTPDQKSVLNKNI